MKNMKYINPVQVAFTNWLNEYPNSGHPLDMERFYCFVATAIRYRKSSRKWINKEYFFKQCGNKVVNKERFYSLLMDIYYFVSSGASSLSSVVRNISDDSLERNYMIHYVDKGTVIHKRVDRGTFESVNSLKRAKAL